jgi:PIN domain nuclease of toxin-antitoxin system
MRLLLDTSAFLWWITDSDRLSVRCRALIGDTGHEVFFSAASSWELVIKAGLGRVTLPKDPDHFIADQVVLNAFQVLPIHLRHTLRVARLPSLHHDPFDRLLVAQAQVESLTLLSPDALLARYPISVIW